DPERRRAALELLGPPLRQRDADPRVREACVDLGAALDDRDAESAREAAPVLVEALARAPLIDGAAGLGRAPAARQVARRLGPVEGRPLAAAAAARLLEQIERGTPVGADPDAEPAAVLASLAGQLGPEDAAAVAGRVLDRMERRPSAALASALAAL